MDKKAVAGVAELPQASLSNECDNQNESKDPAKTPENPGACRTSCCDGQRAEMAILGRHEVVRKLYDMALWQSGDADGDLGIAVLCERAAELLQDNDEAVLAFRTETSFPFLKIAREFHADYAEVLRIASAMECAASAEDFAPGILSPDPLTIAISQAVGRERSRRYVIKAKAFEQVVKIVGEVLR